MPLHRAARSVDVDHGKRAVTSVNRWQPLEADSNNFSVLYLNAWVRPVSSAKRKMGTFLLRILSQLMRHTKICDDYVKWIHAG